ncbi:serpin B6-like [Uloborus diversus]|uniref:serpin B6-like n=1 Tax=Uloborus diversus TaxID=327109 RepID=UPI00240A901C|nr:serpin B6-like [Uloborus diversus]
MLQVMRAMDMLASVLVLCTFAFAEAADTCGRRRISLPHEDVKQLATANNYLAFNLYRELTFDSQDNVFFSPFTISSAFGALYFGARGKTSQELKEILGYQEANFMDESVHISFFYYLSEILPKFNSPENILSTACALLVNKNIVLIPEYKFDVQKLYEALVQAVDFKQPSTMQEINTWVKQRTHGKIDCLMDSADETTAFVLLTAAYFKGAWRMKFDSKNTILKPFYNGGMECRKKDVPTMHLSTTVRYVDSFEKDFQAIELPYKGKHVSMLILLPGSLSAMGEMEDNLSPQNFTTIRRTMYFTKVNISLPKFKVSYSQELSENMKALGAKDIFKPSADFSGMVLTNSSAYLSEVLHKAFIDVNEEGTEAASLTSIITTRMMPGAEDVPEFIVDRPFMFAIIDHKSSMVLFLGRVNSL